MKAVLDVNVLVSALLSRSGAPAQLLSHWLEGAFELVVSPLVLDELGRVMAYPKLRRHISAARAHEVVEWLSRTATLAPDPEWPPPQMPDPDDAYLLALAQRERAALVTGDGHLLPLEDTAPVFTPRAFLELLRQRG